MPATRMATHHASKRSLPNAQVLRANKESILTVIEVFIHDPLYKWALTTTAANRRQHDGGAADEVGGCGLGVGGYRVGSVPQTQMALDLRAGLAGLLPLLDASTCSPGCLYLTHASSPSSVARQVDDGSGETGGAGAAGAGAGVNLANADAERTLLRIKQKLEGVEAGE